MVFYQRTIGLHPEPKMWSGRGQGALVPTASRQFDPGYGTTPASVSLWSTRPLCVAYMVRLSACAGLNRVVRPVSTRNRRRFRRNLVPRASVCSAEASVDEWPHFAAVYARCSTSSRSSQGLQAAAVPDNDAASSPFPSSCSLFFATDGSFLRRGGGRGMCAWLCCAMCVVHRPCVRFSVASESA